MGNVRIISHQSNGNVLAGGAAQDAVPALEVFVGDARRDVKNENGTLRLQVMSAAEIARFELAHNVNLPDVDFHGAPGCVEEDLVECGSDGMEARATQRHSHRLEKIDELLHSDPTAPQQQQFEFRNVVHWVPKRRRRTVLMRMEEAVFIIEKKETKR